MITYTYIYSLLPIALVHDFLPQQVGMTLRISVSLLGGDALLRCIIIVKVSSHSRKFEFKIFSMVHSNDHNF